PEERLTVLGARPPLSRRPLTKRSQLRPTVHVGTTSAQVIGQIADEPGLVVISPRRRAACGSLASRRKRSSRSASTFGCGTLGSCAGSLRSSEFRPPVRRHGVFSSR